MTALGDFFQNGKEYFYIPDFFRQSLRFLNGIMNSVVWERQQIFFGAFHFGKGNFSAAKCLTTIFTKLTTAVSAVAINMRL